MTKKRTLLSITMIVTIFSLAFVGCEEENDVKMKDVTVKVIVPDAMEGTSAEGLAVKFTNKNSGSVKTESTNGAGEVLTPIEEGLYDIEVSGRKIYSQVINDSTTTQQEVNLTGLQENVAISSTSGTVEIPLSISIPNKGWVIKEIYFSGSKTPSGGSYNKDQFIEIYNNTDSMMYADGISIGESANLTNKNINIYQTDIDHSTFIKTLYTIPGNGTNWPVEPGKSILMAPQPINHKNINSNSVDLSLSDFQWYDAHATLAIQVPEVPDMIKYYSYSLSIWVLNTKGDCSIVAFKSGNMENYVDQYTDSRPNSNGIEQKSVRVPNAFILDAVETGKLEGIGSKSFAASVDLGYTGCSSPGSGKSVRRKVAEVKDGRVIYQDTNNSSVDFIKDATPEPKEFKQ